MTSEAALTRLDDDFTRPYRLPYQLGVFLATNAIPDAYAVIDGPDCLFRKAEWVHGKHDIFSTLLDVLGNHRIVSTLVNAEAVIKDRGEMVATRVRQVGQIPGARMVTVCAMPHVMIIGTQYDRILRSLEADVDLDLMEVPSLSLQGDWVDGYVETLAAIAAKVDVTSGRPDPKKVAVIGYFMDRTEADHTANVAELRRVFEGIGLEVTSIWLSNSPYDALADAREAGNLVALPMGRKAAKVLASRTGANVVEAEVPLGASRTQRMLRKVARAAGVPQVDVDRFVDAELSAIVPRLEWVVPHVFFGKRVGFAGPPDLLGGMYSIALDVGMDVAFLASSCRPEHFGEDLEAEFGSAPPIYFSPTQNVLKQLRARLGDEGSLDLLMADSAFTGLFGEEGPLLPIGFPSHHDHAIFERPYVGFRGWLCLLDRMAQCLGQRAKQGGRRQGGSAPDSERRRIPPASAAR
jgi:nitrogenase molybdenum-iron protein alpha/beta subunit